MNDVCYRVPLQHLHYTWDPYFTTPLMLRYAFPLRGLCKVTFPTTLLSR